MNACSTPRTTVLFLAGLMLAATAVSKEIMVTAGDGTLQAAINDAGTVDGDTLVLAAGTYSNLNGFDVTKSLTIRPASASTSAVLVDTLELNAANIVIQGLQFSNVNMIGGFPGVTWVIVENTFVDGSPSFNGSPEALYVVGNDIQITSGNLFPVGWRAGKLVYAAANSIVVTDGIFGVDIRNADEAYLVGNDFDVPVPNNGELIVDFISTTRSYMIGNRFDVGLTLDYGLGAGNRLMARVEGTPIARNNLFALTDISGLDGTSLVAGVPMITVDTNSDFGRIENNVFDFNGLNLNATATAASGVIHTNSVVTVQSNIIVNTDRPIFTEAAATVAFNTFRNNLCFNTTAEMCPAGDGNLNVNPDFVDTTNYQLNPNSPAVDAGPDLAVLTDLDGTRVDLGLYGGGFPIDQYDAQRTDATTAPWVFPVFDATGDVGIIGDLPIRIIGFARIR